MKTEPIIVTEDTTRKEEAYVFRAKGTLDFISINERALEPVEP